MCHAPGKYKVLRAILCYEPLPCDMQWDGYARKKQIVIVFGIEYNHAETRMYRRTEK